MRGKAPSENERWRAEVQMKSGQGDEYTEGG